MDSVLYYFRRARRESEAVYISLYTLLVDAGLNIHRRTQSGQITLHGAAKGASEVLIRPLLAAGADINAVDNEGNTPIHLVATAKCLALLVEDGHANIDLANKQGKTPLMTILRSYAESDRAWKLLEYGPDCNLLDQAGNTALHLAVNCSEEDTSLIRLLIEAGADPNARNHEGLTPLLMMKFGTYISYGILTRSRPFSKAEPESKREISKGETFYFVPSQRVESRIAPWRILSSFSVLGSQNTIEISRYSLLQTGDSIPLANNLAGSNRSSRSCRKLLPRD